MLKVIKPRVTDEYLGSVPFRKLFQHCTPACPYLPTLPRLQQRKLSQDQGTPSSAEPDKLGEDKERARGHPSTPELNGQSLSHPALPPPPLSLLCQDHFLISYFDLYGFGVI